jgi:hypothetical protein
MPRTDAFGVQHITPDDQITDEGLDHVTSDWSVGRACDAGR